LVILGLDDRNMWLLHQLFGGAIVLTKYIQLNRFSPIGAGQNLLTSSAILAAFPMPIRTFLILGVILRLALSV
jgi:hypothetical protein